MPVGEPRPVLARDPNRSDEANWDYLVRSMGVLDLFAVGDVCGCLLKIEAATEDPEAVRQVILQGCKLVEAGQDPREQARIGRQMHRRLAG